MVSAIISQIIGFVRDFFNSHKYLKLTFVAIILLFVGNTVATFVAGFNVQCTTDGEVRELNSWTVTPTLYTLDLALGKYFETGADGEVNESGFILLQDAPGLIEDILVILFDQAVQLSGINVTDEVSPDFRDQYLIAHSTEYDAPGQSDFTLDNSVRFACRDKTPTLTFFKLDILNFKLWFSIFLIGELMLLYAWLRGNFIQ